MPTKRQDDDFSDMLEGHVDTVKILPTALDEAISWMQSQLEPDDIFSEKQLAAWAESNGWTKD